MPREWKLTSLMISACTWRLIRCTSFYYFEPSWIFHLSWRNPSNVLVFMHLEKQQTAASLWCNWGDETLQVFSAFIKEHVSRSHLVSLPLSFSFAAAFTKSLTYSIVFFFSCIFNDPNCTPTPCISSEKPWNCIIISLHNIMKRISTCYHCECTFWLVFFFLGWNCEKMETVQGWVTQIARCNAVIYGSTWL